MSAGVRGLKPGTLVTCRVGKGPCPPPQRTAWALRQTGLPCGLTEAGIVGPQPRGEGLSLDGITLDQKRFSSSQFRDFSASLPHAQASCMGSRPSARPCWTMAPSADLCPRVPFRAAPPALHRSLGKQRGIGRTLGAREAQGEASASSRGHVGASRPRRGRVARTQVGRPPRSTLSQTAGPRAVPAAP